MVSAAKFFSFKGNMRFPAPRYAVFQIIKTKTTERFPYFAKGSRVKSC